MPTGPTPSLEGLEPLSAEAPTPNGHPPAADSFEAKLIHDLDGAIRERRDIALALEAEVENAKAKLAEANAVLKRYEDTRRRLLGEPKPESVKRRTRAREGERTHGAVGPGRVDEIRERVLDYVRDHEVDEFAQVDIRGVTGYSSSIMTQAFEALRQEGMIRLARKEGNRKLYRLTSAGMAKAAGR
jgi:DNA-binding transcriptional ArsR family regulator